MEKLKKSFCIALVSILLGGCAASSPVSPPASPPESEAYKANPAYDRLTIYTAFPEEEISVYLNAFRKDTGIAVDYTRFAAGEMIARTREEKEAPRVSVLLGGAADNYVQADSEGLLEPYQSPELINVSEAYLDQKGVWNPLYIGVICFACNQDWFAATGEDYPASWDDLLAPELSGQVVMSYPQTSGTSYTMLAAIVQQRGEEQAWAYLRALNENTGCYTYSGVESVERMRRGEYAVAIAFSHDARRAALDGYPVELRFPTDGTGYEIGACALVRGGPAAERENARHFIDWMTSQRGQECYIEAKSSRLPANSTARRADGLPTLQDIQVATYNSEWAGMNRIRLIEQFMRQITGTKDDGAHQNRRGA